MKSCVCGKTECLETRKKYQVAGDLHMSGVTKITYGPTSKPIRFSVSHHLHLSKEDEESLADYQVAFIHWHPSLVQKNKEDGRKFSVPIERSECKGYDCGMLDKINSYQKCAEKSGLDLSLAQTVKTKSCFVQAPCYPLASSRMDADVLCKPARGQLSSHLDQASGNCAIQLNN